VLSRFVLSEEARVTGPMTAGTRAGGRSAGLLVTSTLRAAALERAAYVRLPG